MPFGYKSKKTKLKEQAAVDAAEAAKIKQLKDDKILLEAKQIIEDKKIAEEKAKAEPFLNLKGLVQQSDGKIKIDLDWDDAFIKKLKESGYTGPDENAIIQKYLLELTSEIADDMGGDSEYE